MAMLSQKKVLCNYSKRVSAVFTWGATWFRFDPDQFHLSSLLCLCISSESWQLSTPGLPYLPSGGQGGLNADFGSRDCVSGSFPVWLVCLSSLLRMPCLWTRLTTGGIPKLDDCAKRSLFFWHSQKTCIFQLKRYIIGHTYSCEALYGR